MWKWKQVALSLLIELLLATALEIAVTDKGIIQGVSKQSLPSPRGEAKLSQEDQTMLDLTNQKRAQHCANPLVWSDDLALMATNWVNGNKVMWDNLGHDPLNNKQPAWASENLYGHSSKATATDAIEAWYAEINNCQGTPTSFLDGCFTGTGVRGHFTLLVWQNITHVGCALSNDERIYGCKYSGFNKRKQANQNVLNGGYKTHVLPQKCPGSPPSPPAAASLPLGSAIGDSQVINITNRTMMIVGQTGGNAAADADAADADSGAALAAQVVAVDAGRAAGYAAKQVCRSPEALNGSFHQSPFGGMIPLMNQHGFMTGGVIPEAESHSSTEYQALNASADENQALNRSADVNTSADGWQCVAGYCGTDGRDHSNDQEDAQAYDMPENDLKNLCAGDPECKGYQINNISSDTQWKGLMKTLEKINGAYGTSAQKEVARCCIKPTPAAALLNIGGRGFGNAGKHHLEPNAVSGPAAKKNLPGDGDLAWFRSLFDSLAELEKGICLEILALRVSHERQQRLMELCKDTFEEYVSGQ